MVTVRDGEELLIKPWKQERLQLADSCTNSHDASSVGSRTIAWEKWALGMALVHVGVSKERAGRVPAKIPGTAIQLR